MNINNNTDYFDILGVSHSSTSDEIRRARNRLAFRFHPDRNDSDREKENVMKLLKRYYRMRQMNIRTKVV